MVGAKLLDRVVCFSKTGTELTEPISLTFTGSEIIQVLIADIEPGVWNVEENGAFLTSVTASDEGRSIYFAATGGEYILSKSTSSTAHDNQFAQKYIIHQNYPNPFNSSTTISFKLHKPSQVRLSIYNLSGQLIEVLIDEFLDSGIRRVVWDAVRASSGMYIYTIEVDEITQVGKMLLLK